MNHHDEPTTPTADEYREAADLMVALRERDHVGYRLHGATLYTDIAGYGAEDDEALIVGMAVTTFASIPMGVIVDVGETVHVLSRRYTPIVVRLAGELWTGMAEGTGARTHLRRAY